MEHLTDPEPRIRRINALLNRKTSFEDFKLLVYELDAMRSRTISEHNDDLISDILDNLYNKCPYQLVHFINNNDREVFPSGQTFVNLCRTLLLTDL